MKMKYTRKLVVEQWSVVEWLRPCLDYRFCLRYTCKKYRSLLVVSFRVEIYSWPVKYTCRINTPVSEYTASKRGLSPYAEFVRA